MVSLFAKKEHAATIDVAVDYLIAFLGSPIACLNDWSSADLHEAVKIVLDAWYDHREFPTEMVDQLA